MIFTGHCYPLFPYGNLYQRFQEQQHNQNMFHVSAGRCGLALTKASKPNISHPELLREQHSVPGAASTPWESVLCLRVLQAMFSCVSYAVRNAGLDLEINS